MAYGDDDVLSASFASFVYIIAGLPLSALAICIFLSLILHFEPATRTHCGVENWLPSISAAVSTYAPEMYIWRIFIAIHCGPRLVLAFAYRNYFLSSPLRPHGRAKLFKLASRFACFLNFLENLFLIGLTCISSVENHEMHKICFGGFTLCSTLYMFLSIYIFDKSGRRRATRLGEKSYEYKILASAVSILSIILSMYLYWRHNTYCEPGVYTLFAIAEYCIVLANIFFHSTAYYDFHGKRITLASSGGSFGYEALQMDVEKNT